jgi:transcriptional regulator with XRE-family HTH domain
VARSAPPSPGATTHDDETATLGPVIRSLRLERGLRLVDVAEASGLSVSFLSQLERGLTRPSLASLHQVAETLGTSSQALLGQRAVEDPDPLVSRALRSDPSSFAEGIARPLVHGRRTLQPMEFTGGPLEFGEWFVHDGDELLHVLEGRIEVDIDGDPLRALGAGDTIYVEAGVLHRWRRVPGKESRVLFVLHNLGADDPTSHRPGH